MNGKIMLNGKAYSSSGRPSKEVTMSEWLALPDTKYTDGIVYYIKDVGSSSQYPPLIYSDYEREVGVWRDGKPLYQKTYEITSVVFGGVTNNNNLILTPEIEVKNYEGYILRSNNRLDGFIKGYHESINGIDTNQNVSQMTIRRQSASPNNVTIQFSVTSALQSDFQKVIVTIQYTKTTDLPGSGMWNTDGGKMHHYSTDEKVIGSWIDGKPIYEKTIELESQQQIASGSWYNLPMSNTGIAKIISVTAMNQTGTRWECVGGNCDVGSYCQLANFRSDYIGVKVVTLQYTKTTD